MIDPNTLTFGLSNPYELQLKNQHTLNPTDFNIFCIGPDAFVLRNGDTFHCVIYQSSKQQFSVKKYSTLKLEDKKILSLSVLGPDPSLILILTNTDLLKLSLNPSTRELQASVLLTNATKKYEHICTVSTKSLFLVTENNELELYDIANPLSSSPNPTSPLILRASVSLDKIKQGRIRQVFIEPRSQKDNYVGLMATSYNARGFEKQTLSVLEIDSSTPNGVLTVENFDVDDVRVEGFLRLHKFRVYMHEEKSTEYLEVCMNNQIIIICKFVKKYMIWEAVYNKKIKEDVVDFKLGLVAPHSFYVAHKLHIEIYDLCLIQDKASKMTLLQIKLRDFIPDEMSLQLPFLGACNSMLGQIIVNKQKSNNNQSVCLRHTFSVDILEKLSQAVTLMTHQKQLEKELPVLIDFISKKTNYSKKQVQKLLWLRWPRVLEKNSEFIKKLLAVNDPVYIEEQIRFLLSEGPLKIELVEDLLQKCQNIYKKEISKSFNTKTVLSYIKCNFRLKKMRLHMGSCKRKLITNQEYLEIEERNIAKEIKLYFEEFRKADLQIALGLFAKHFFASYEENIIYAFERIRDLTYFVSNFNFLFPLPKNPQIWEMRLEKRENEIQLETLKKWHAATKQKTPELSSWQDTLKELKAGCQSYMVDNDIFPNPPLPETGSISSFEDAYYNFFTALIRVANADADQTFRILDILAVQNEIQPEIKDKLEVILELYFMLDSPKVDLKTMLKLTAEALFIYLLELEIYEEFVTIVRECFDELESHSLCESFSTYLKKYFVSKGKGVLCPHFAEILKAAKTIDQEDYEMILETLIDCIYETMRISQSEHVQNYIQTYFLYQGIKSPTFKTKLLRLENIIARQDLFSSLQANLTLLEIEFGDKVIQLKMEKYFAKPDPSKFMKFVDQLVYLREEFYLEIPLNKLLNDLLHSITNSSITKWGSLVNQLLSHKIFSKVLEAKALLQEQVLMKRNSIYSNNSEYVRIKTQMQELMIQYGEPTFRSTETLRLEWLSMIHCLPNQTPDKCIHIDTTEACFDLYKLIDQPEFYELLPQESQKKRLVELFFKLNSHAMSMGYTEKSVLSQMALKQILRVCEQALEERNFQRFLECFEEHLTKKRDTDNLDLKLLWIKFMGYYAQENYWNQSGKQFLKRCLYLIADFKESMHYFFSFLNEENEEMFEADPELAIRMSNSFLKAKGQKWVLHQIAVIEKKMSKHLSGELNTVEFMFRYLLLVDNMMAFYLLKRSLKEVDIDNIYRIVVISLESEYIVYKTAIINSLLETICQVFVLAYPNQTGSLSQITHHKLLSLILKLKPNAKDEASRNQLTFYETIIANTVRLKQFYERIGDKKVVQDMNQASSRHIDEVINTLQVFNSTILPVLKLSASDAKQSAEKPFNNNIQIGECLVESEADESRLTH